MNKFWLDHYPEDVVHEINPDTYKNLGSIIEQSAEKFSDKKAVTCMGSSLTFTELNQLAEQFASFLQQKLSLKKGDKLAIMLPNTPQYLLALFAAFKIGVIVINVNPLYTPKELSDQINNSGAETILLLENFGHTLEKALPNIHIKNIIISKIGDLLPFPKKTLVNLVVKYVKKMVPAFTLPNSISLTSALDEGKKCKRQEVEVTGEDIAFLQYTGGTTGVPKGAILTHRNVVANVLQGKSFVEKRFAKEKVTTMILPLPIYHIYALTLSLFMISFGIEDVLIVNPRDLKTFVKVLKQTDYKGFIGLNTLFHALLNNPEFRKLKFPKRFYTIAGGMSVKPNVAKEWKEVTGSPIVEGYGLTEASPIITLNPIDITEFDGTIGHPMPSIDIDVRDENGNSVGIGQPGELCVKGPNIMKGYWENPEETAIIFTDDGWMRTGDIVEMREDGKIKILDRKKDMINVGGFNVFPNEVEEVLLEHPDIVEAAVVGAPDEHSGEMVQAFIVSKRSGLTQEEVLSHCEKTLTGYKRPHKVIFKNELPKSAVGKVLRAKLKEPQMEGQSH